ncbi:MAG: HEAT repeat domain-containing protein [Deltaproteobacteria bacterium]|nr:HEAT repeat domain-containing protein [Deltaproteobacteria bacterium]
MRGIRFVSLSILFLFCMGFEWPERLSRLKSEMRYADAARRREIIRLFAEYPSAEVGDALLNALEDDDPRVRLEAARCAAKVQLRKAAPVLLEWLRQPQIETRAQAVRTLGELADTSTLPVFVALLNDDQNEVRRAAASALGRLVAPELLEPLLGRLDDPDTTVRARVVRALGQLGDPRAVEPILSRFDREAVEVRIEALSALGKLGDKRALNSLLEALSHGSDEERFMAAAAIGELGGDAAVDALSDSLSNSDPRTAKAIIAALGMVKHQRVDKTIVDKLADPELGWTAGELLIARARRNVMDKNGETEELIRALADGIDNLQSPDGFAMMTRTLSAISRFVSIEPIAPALIRKLEQTGDEFAEYLLPMLGASGAKEALEPLLQRVEGAEPSGLDGLISALSAYFERASAERRMVEPLLALLEIADDRQRSELLELVGKIGAVETLPRLRQLAIGEKPAVQIAAVKALGAIGDPACVSDLLALVKSNDKSVRAQAARALGRVADARAVEALIGRLGQGHRAPHGELMAALANSLSRLGRTDELTETTAQRALELLSRVAADQNPRRSAHALDALALWGDPRAAKTVGMLLRNPSVFRRVEALSALASFHTSEVKNVLRQLIRSSKGPILVAATVSLGEQAEARDTDRFIELSKRAYWPARAAALYALARSLRRSPLQKGSIQRKLCSIDSLTDPYERANFAAAMAAIGAPPCPDNGPNPLAWLGRGQSQVVRASAARWAYAAAEAGRLPNDEVGRALWECSQSEPDPVLAQACRFPRLPELDGEIEITAYSLDRVRILRNKLVAVRLADATVYIGYTDANGHLRIRNAPRGDFQLERV